MLYVEEIKMDYNERKNKTFIFNSTYWEYNGLSRDLDTKIRDNEMYVKIDDRCLFIRCDDDEYIEPVKIKGGYAQFTGSMDDGRSDGKFNLILIKAKNLYINLSEGFQDEIEKDNLTKNYLLKVVNNTGNKVIYYGLVVSLELKNTDSMDGLKYTIDVKVYLHELKEVNLILDSIDVTFFVAMGYYVVQLICKSLSWSVFDIAMIAVVITYLVQLIIRTKHVKNTYINKIWAWFLYKTKKTTSYRFKFNIREFRKRLKKSHLIYAKNQKYDF